MPVPQAATAAAEVTVRRRITTQFRGTVKFQVSAGPAGNIQVALKSASFPSQVQLSSESLPGAGHDVTGEPAASEPELTTQATVGALGGCQPAG